MVNESNIVYQDRQGFILSDLEQSFTLIPSSAFTPQYKHKLVSEYLPLSFNPAFNVASCNLTYKPSGDLYLKSINLLITASKDKASLSLDLFVKALLPSNDITCKEGVKSCCLAEYLTAIVDIPASLSIPIHDVSVDSVKQVVAVTYALKNLQMGIYKYVVSLFKELLNAGTIDTSCYLKLLHVFNGWSANSNAFKFNENDSNIAGIFNIKAMVSYLAVAVN